VIRRGWARVDVDAGPFARRPAYESAEEQADGGVWARCNGDFHLDSAQQRKDSARAFVRRYYRHLSARRFRRAWEMLGARRKAQVRPFRRWRAGYRSSRGVAVVSARPRLSGSRRAVVRVRLRARDRDVCSGALVRQTFAGQVVLAAVGDSWSIVRFRIRKTGGRTPRVSKSECTPRPQPQPDPAPSPPRDCQGYDPCLTPGPDYDCAGGSGNGPRYVDGPVYVGGSDPYGLDSDGDGVACES
jgi:hypothetical protein